MDKFNKMENRNIVFYDGECGFCQATIQFLLDHDKRGVIHYAAIQSEFTVNFFNQLGELQPDLSTFYFYSNGKLKSKSAGALSVLKFLTFPYPLLIVFRIIPQFIRDFVYDLIAKNRLKLASNSCRIPSVEEKGRFIS